MRASRFLSVLAWVFAAGCSPPPSSSDSGVDVAPRSDSATAVDSEMDAAQPADASSDAGFDVAVVDSSSADASVDASADGGSVVLSDASADGGPSNVAILGTLYGSCGVLPPMITAAEPSLVNNLLVFMAPERYERSALSMGGQRIFDAPNAGGSSIESEVFAFEVLHHCEGASLTATETEIQYAAPDDAGPNTITDILVTIGGQRVGVSVTRIYRPAPMVLTDADVRAQLVTKLVGINRSTVRVLPAFRWVKQVLSVFVANQTVADQVARVWPTIDGPTRANTIVLVTTTRGGGFIYCNPDPALGAECPSL